MSPRILLWVQIVVGTLAASATLAILSPPSPASRLPALAALAGGAVAGLCLYLGIARTRPSFPCCVRRPSVTALKYGVVGVLAANEEIVWRRLVLGECLRAGTVAALAGSTLAFALAHRARPALHLGTGAAFGGVYVGSGALVASVAAHWSYNALLMALADRKRRQDWAPGA